MTQNSSSSSLIDWSTEPPTVTEDGVVYKLWDGGSLSICTPKALAKLVKRLRTKQSGDSV